MILTDRRGHLVSDTHLDELHGFAKGLDLKREYYQGGRRVPHYDLTTANARRRALAAGATLVKSTALVRRAVKCWVPKPADLVDRAALLHGALESVHELCEGPLMGYFVRGHVDKVLFMDTVEWEDPEAPDYYGGAVPLYEVHHCWWRSIPTRQCADYREWQVMLCRAPGPAPGAYPVTVYYVEGSPTGECKG